MKKKHSKSVSGSYIIDPDGKKFIYNQGEWL